MLPFNSMELPMSTYILTLLIYYNKIRLTNIFTMFNIYKLVKTILQTSV